MNTVKNINTMEIGKQDLKQNDLYLVGDSEIKSRGLVSHHIESANRFYEEGISSIILQNFSPAGRRYSSEDRKDGFRDSNLEYVDLKIVFTDAKLSKPMMVGDMSNPTIMFPNVARRNGRTYSGEIHISADIIATGFMKDRSVVKKTTTVTNVLLGAIPILLRSKYCNTYNKSRAELEKIHEDYSDPGGYFIVKGNPWAIDNNENNRYNLLRIFSNKGHKKELYRAEFMSKPGDAYQNQGYFVFRWTNDRQMTCEIAKASLDKVDIPFFLLFRLLGAQSDFEIIQNIIYDLKSKVGKRMIMLMKETFDAKYVTPGMENSHYIYEREEILRVIVNGVKAINPNKWARYKLDVKDSNYKLAYAEIIKEIDMNLFPHIGMQPCDRPKKMRFLGSVARSLLLLSMGMIRPTDRDSILNKRIHSTGPSYAKPFKSLFNISILQKILRQYGEVFYTQQFDNVDLSACFNRAIHSSEFKRQLEHGITIGTKSIIIMSGSHGIPNRLASQQLIFKNQLNVISILRGIITQASDSFKQSERANLMRRVHMTGIGFICVVHSPDGSNVGLNKQLALFASITDASSSVLLREQIGGDSLVIPEDKVNVIDIPRLGLKTVLVYGYPVGYTKDTAALVRKYRKMRREGKGIDRYVTIYWNEMRDLVEFECDFGRLIRPLTIVYNNRRDPEMFKASERKSSAPFRQGILLNKKHVDQLRRREITIENLTNQMVVEYITPPEQANMVLCPDYNRLVESQFDETKPWTHCDVPEAQFGITALTSPMGNHNQAPRVTFQTNQSRQTCGIFALNWPYTYDKTAYLQYESETPLVRTVVDRYIRANGFNCIVAIMCYTGDNVEDSCIINKGAVDRGLFNCCKFTYQKTELEAKEEFASPDLLITTDIKIANCEHLVNGFVRRGAIVHSGDAIIGKRVKVSNSIIGETKHEYADRSVIYKKNELAYIHDVIKGFNEDDKRFCKVILRNPRPVVIGDKFSSRAAQKGVCATLMRDSDMPRTSDGLSPSIIVNPHSMPKRMTVGQLFESIVSTLCAAKGIHMDGTMFHETDLEKVAAELKKLGFSEDGTRKMYSGITGEMIQTRIFIGPVYIQRLQKFIVETVYGVAKGRTNVLTRQMISGQSRFGGIKIGEMESRAISSDGTAIFHGEKFRDHSDGYTWYICRCGRPAVVNHKKNWYRCSVCGDNADIAEIETSYSSKLLFQELNTMNIGTKFHIKPITRYIKLKPGQRPPV